MFEGFSLNPITLAEWINDQAVLIHRRLKFGKKQQALLLRALAKPMKRGASIKRVAEHIGRHGSEVQQEIAHEILERTRSGEPKAPAFKGWIDDVSVAALEAGEKANLFAKSMEVLAESLDRRGKGISELVKTSLYPLIMFVVTTAVVIGVNSKVIPVFQNVLRGKSTSAIDNFVELAAFYQHYLWLVVLALFMLWLLVCERLRNYVGDYRDRFDQIPVINSYRYAVGSKLVGMYALLRKFDLKPKRSLEILHQHGTTYQRFHISDMLDQMREGANEVESLDTGLLDHEHISLLHLYMNTDEDYIDALFAASEDLEEKIRDRIAGTALLLKYSFLLAVFYNTVMLVFVIVGFNGKPM